MALYEDSDEVCFHEQWACVVLKLLFFLYKKSFSSFCKPHQMWFWTLINQKLCKRWCLLTLNRIEAIPNVWRQPYHCNCVILTIHEQPLSRCHFWWVFCYTPNGESLCYILYKFNKSHFDFLREFHDKM